jgi:hypothetical protein
MNIEDYTDKSFVVFGETKNFKDILKELGGKFNSNLKVGPGWIFSKANKEKVENWMKSTPNTQTFPNHLITKSSSGNKKNLSKLVIDEFTQILIEEDDLDYSKKNEYKSLFMEMLINRKDDVSFEDFSSFDIDKIIDYSYITSSRMK